MVPFDVINIGLYLLNINDCFMNNHKGTTTQLTHYSSQPTKHKMVNDNTPVAPSTSSASGCPVLASGGGSGGDSIPSSSKPGIWNRWFSRSNNAEQISADNLPSVANNISECPVKGSSKSLPASIEEAAKHSQLPAPGQKIPLSTQRVISSIPRGEDGEEDASTDNTKSIPAHQPVNSQHWQYPSEQQFYNAMLKKGYRPPVESIPSVLQIHNAVNERSWLQVCKWEKEIHNNVEPRLVKFVGRPKDISPKAWLNSRVFMTQEPFDRHDWFIEDKDGGEPRRYVIDFYEGKEKTGDLVPSLSSAATGKDGKIGGGSGSGSSMPVMKPPSMYIDVRPALDNPSAAVDRMTMVVREALPGLTGVWDSYKASSSSQSSSSVAEMEGVKKNKDGTSAK